MPRHGVVRQHLRHIGEDSPPQDLDKCPQGQVRPLQSDNSASHRIVLSQTVEPLHCELERRKCHLQKVKREISTLYQYVVIIIGNCDLEALVRATFACVSAYGALDALHHAINPLLATNSLSNQRLTLRNTAEGLYFLFCLATDHVLARGRVHRRRSGAT